MISIDFQKAFKNDRSIGPYLFYKLMCRYNYNSRKKKEKYFLTNKNNIFVTVLNAL